MQCIQQVGDDPAPDQVLALDRVLVQMRDGQDVRVPDERVVRPRRLALEDVERSAVQPAAIKCIEQGCLVDQPGVDDIDQHGAGFDPRESGGVEQVVGAVRVGGQGQDDIGALQQFIQADRFGAGRAGEDQVGVGIVNEGVHPECPRPGDGFEAGGTVEQIGVDRPGGGDDQGVSGGEGGEEVGV
ncbi:MAG TPA: hypothetical protein VMN57_04325 [Anaerolineales bacterium]|nr:hypothetical protein [Anaerolineales bacterium]